MFRRFTALALIVSALSGCDSDRDRNAANPRQVTVVGTGQVQGTPDTLTADVGVEFTAPDVTTATITGYRAASTVRVKIRRTDAEAPGGAQAPAPRAGMATNVPLQPGQQTVNFAVTAVCELG